MREFIICKLINTEETLLLKGKASPECYWIEWMNPNKETVMEYSQQVDKWEDAVKLLKAYRWNTYETQYVNPSFAYKIMEARNKKINSQQRILTLYDRFLRGDEMVKKTVAEEFKVGTEQIGRDFSKLRARFADNNQTIKYDRIDKVFRLSSLDGELFAIEDAIALLLMIYTSRIFNEEEIERLTGKLLQPFSLENQRNVKRFLQSFFHYYEPIQTENILGAIRDTYYAINHRRVLAFYYSNDKTTYREVIPYGLTFHNGMLYILATKKDSNYKKPVPWRLDRITDLKVTNKRFVRKEPYLELGKYINQSMNMFTGTLQKVKLKIAEHLLEYLYRAFPGVATIKSKESEWLEVEIEVNGFQGILFWILQQAEFVEVLGPIELRQEVKEKIRKMQEIYAKDEPLV